MPELPEVETVKRGLEIILSHDQLIARVEVIRTDLRDKVSPKNLKSLEGQRICGVRRRAKYLLIETEQNLFVSHLGMTGSWRVAPSGDDRKHDHIYLHLNDGQRLAFNDPRRFGMAEVIPRGSEEKYKRFMNLGPEPLAQADFSPEWVFAQTRGREACIKIWLMDQKNVVGVGNIYASEALFRAGVRPTRLAGKLKRLEAERLVPVIRQVLERAIEKGGSTIRDFRQAGGSEGYFQNEFMVYDRAGEPCRTCGTLIRQKVLGGRSSYWCPSCQR